MTLPSTLSPPFKRHFRQLAKFTGNAVLSNVQAVKLAPRVVLSADKNRDFAGFVQVAWSVMPCCLSHLNRLVTQRLLCVTRVSLVFAWLMALSVSASPLLSSTSPTDFFTNVASRLLRAELGQDLNRIQVYPTNQYTPEVQPAPAGLRQSLRLHYKTDRSSAGPISQACSVQCSPMIQAPFTSAVTRRKQASASFGHLSVISPIRLSARS